MELRDAASGSPRSHEADEDFPHKDSISLAHLHRLEDEIREALKMQRTVYEGEKSILTKLLRFSS